MSKPKKILMVNEANYALSGFGTYGKELLNRLFDSGKYHLAEFASYAAIGDERDKDTRWRFYPNAVNADDERFAEYNSKERHKFGEWRFESVLLDFKPDIVFDIRDPWMMLYEGNSPLRKFFNWTIMPTVDSVPQRMRWVQLFADADALFVYSDWALDALKQQHSGLKLQRSAPPGVDPKLYRPVKDKQEHKRNMNLPDDSIIFGTVMRNQVRKLYPDLFKAFRMFLDSAPKEIADKCYLYCHVSYPDKGWDIPELLQEFELGNKVWFTYLCRETNRPYCIPFQGARTYSPFSNAPTGTLPNVTVGLTQEQMVQVYNAFDCYIQYSVCEGFGMPQVEAAACGVPVMAVNYSAMADVIKNTGGIPLKVERMFRDLGTGSYRALPDNQYCAKKMLDFVTNINREALSKKGIQAVQNIYNWDRTADIWMDYFDSVQLTGLQGKWDTPPQLCDIPKAIPKGLNNEQFTRWLFHNVIYEPQRDHSLHALEIMRDLNYGITLTKGELKRTSRQEIFELFQKYAQNKNMCEQFRLNGMPDTPDFIQYAHMKEQAGRQK